MVDEYVEDKILIKIANENELNNSWFINKKLCGVTAGASTPDWIIQQVIDKIESNE
jgi:4-hydroxy-3-methylbut-2-enyl diphosphate reductase